MDTKRLAVSSNPEYILITTKTLPSDNSFVCNPLQKSSYGINRSMKTYNRVTIKVSDMYLSTKSPYPVERKRSRILRLRDIHIL